MSTTTSVNWSLVARTAQQMAGPTEPGGIGELGTQRQRTLGEFLGQLETFASAEAGPERSAPAVRLALISDMARRLRPVYERPPEPAATGIDARTQRIQVALGGVRGYLFEEALKPIVPERERGMAGGLMLRVGRYLSALAETAGDRESLTALEREQIRPAMKEIRDLARCRHAALIRPKWGPVSGHDASLVYFAGPRTIQRSLVQACDKRGLRVNDFSPGADLAASRWTGLVRSGLVVFDLTGNDPAVYYDIGLALVTGSEMLLTAREGTRVPFDIAQGVMFYSGERTTGDFFDEVLDEAVYGLQNQGDRSASLEALRNHALSRIESMGAGSWQAAVHHGLEQDCDDAVALGATLRTMTEQARGSGLALALPRWPVTYPEPGTRRAFVAMPFDESRTLTQELYRAVRLRYPWVRRGDEAPDPDIIRSIWDEIGRASMVLVDLTGMNPNVCLEMGIADALGKPVLAIAGEDSTALFPAISKTRVHYYGPAGFADPAISLTIDRFLR